MYLKNEIESKIRAFAMQALFNSKNVYIKSNPIDVYDLGGPLLFLDYLLTSEDGEKGWVRFMPDADEASQNGGIVSAEKGEYPFRFLNKKKLPIITNREKIILGRNKKLSTTLTFEYGLNQLSPNDYKIYCYNYPNLGVMVEKNGELFIKDITTNVLYKINSSESGVAVNFESINPYSFLNQLSESGDPGAIDFPAPELAIPNFTLIPQKKDNWCAAASCQMILKFFNIDIPQEQIAVEMKIPANASSGGASLGNQLLVYQRYLGALNFIADSNPKGQDCVSALQKGHPIKNGIFQHAQVITGWKIINDKKYFQIHDPMPVNIGTVKFQNPYIVFPINYIFSQA